MATGRGRPRQLRRRVRLARLAAVVGLASGLLAPIAAAAAPPRRSPRAAAPGVVAATVPRSGVSLSPLVSAPRLAPAHPPDRASDPRALAVAEALRARVPELRQRAAATSEVAHGRRDALARLRARVPGRVAVRLRERGATPRWIEGELERAAPGPPGHARDLATARALLRRERALLGLRDPDAELALVRAEREESGRSHLRFEQRYRGLRVWPAELQVHLDASGAVDLVNGGWVPTPIWVDPEPGVGAATAAEAARRYVGADPAAPTVDAELLVYAPGDRAARLAWSVVVEASLRARWRALVDARSGRVIDAWNTVMELDVAGSGIDLFGQLRALRVWQEGASYLVDSSKPMFDPSSNPPDPSTTRGAIAILDAAHQPPTSDPQSFPPLLQISAPGPGGPWLADGVSGATNLSRVYEYFLGVHERDSMDGAGGSILAVVRLGLGFANAFYLPESNAIAFGDAAPFAGALDVVAHELTHGVTHHSANLVYRAESGALNEAFSDVFGEMVEADATGSTDWRVGSPPAFAAPVRDLRAPGSLLVPGFGVPYPDRYGEYLSTTLDNGGVHVNSTIVGHAFYLLAAGLPGAIGNEGAARIFYRALTTHLTASARFVDARLACVRAAQELFGAGSAPALRTAQAFDAVEVFDGPGTTDPPDYPGTEGADATLFVRWDAPLAAAFLHRREPPFDGPAGTPLSFWDVSPSRPAVVGDGSFAVFVDSLDDICFLLTDGSQLEEDCLGFPGQIASVSVSPDGTVYGFVLLESAQPYVRDNVITVVDVLAPPGQGDVVDYELRAPTLDGGPVATVLYADAMDFTADDAFVVYDALNRLQVSGGGAVDVWSIYALERATGAVFALVPPSPDVDVGYPALAQRSDHHLVFDVLDAANGASTVFAGDLDSGTTRAIGVNVAGFAVPGYTGDDRAVVFSTADASPTGYSLVAVPVGADRMTPTGGAASWLADADFGVVYRRGTFVPEPDPAAGALAAAAGLAAIARRRASRLRRPVRPPAADPSRSPGCTKRSR